MRRSFIYWPIMAIFLLSLVGCASSNKEFPTKSDLMLSTMPQAKEKVVPPSGYSTCYKSKTGVYNNVWIPSHKVCQYKNMPVAWIEGYWTCQAYDKVNRICTNWAWTPASWSKINVNDTKLKGTDEKSTKIEKANPDL